MGTSIFKKTVITVIYIYILRGYLYIYIKVYFYINS